MPSKHSILIVDDNPLNLKLLKVLLTVEGYIVHSATTAQEALTLLDTAHPNLILMDIQLPDMDGLELTSLLKGNPLYHDIPILAITAFAMKGDKKKALTAGCDGYITKPIDIDAMLIVIDSYLDDSVKHLKNIKSSI